MTRPDAQTPPPPGSPQAAPDPGPATEPEAATRPATPVGPQQGVRARRGRAPKNPPPQPQAMEQLPPRAAAAFRSPPDNQCTATARSTKRRCRRPCNTGSPYCNDHQTAASRDPRRSGPRHAAIRPTRRLGRQPATAKRSARGGKPRSGASRRNKSASRSRGGRVVAASASGGAPREVPVRDGRAPKNPPPQALDQLPPRLAEAFRRDADGD